MFDELERSSFGTLNPCNLSALLMVIVHLSGMCTPVRYAFVMYICRQIIDLCMNSFSFASNQSYNSGICRCEICSKSQANKAF